MPLREKHLLGIEELTLDEIELILNTSRSFREISTRPIKKVPTLRGKSLINLFYEPSTRTRSSFEIAAKRLGADSINVNVSLSSVTKGESLIDTGKNLQSMNPDIIALRHSSAGRLISWLSTVRLSALSTPVMECTSTRRRHYWMLSPYWIIRRRLRASK